MIADKKSGVERHAGSADLQLEATFHYVSSFGAAKLVVYLAPIALAAVAPAYIYGGFEVAQALAMLFGTLLVSAPVHGLSHRHILLIDPTFGAQVRALIVFACLASLVLTLAGMMAGISAYLVLGFSIAGVAGVQIVLSFAIRAVRVGHLLLPWIDGLVIYLALLIVVLLNLLDTAIGLLSLTAAFSAAVFVVGALCLAPVARDLAESTNQLWRNSREGMAMAAYALFGTWVAVCGRLLVGLFSPADVAAYGVAFRVAGVILLLPQLVVIGMWKYLYTCSPARADRLIAATLAGTAALAIAAILVGREFIESFALEALDSEARITCLTLLPVVAVQSFFWSAHMLLQPEVNRRGAAQALILPMGLLTLLGAAAIFLTHRSGGTTTGLVWSITLYCSAYFLFAWSLLRARGVAHNRTLVAVLFGAAAILGAGLL